MKGVSYMFQKIRIRIKIMRLMKIIHKCDYRTQTECVDIIHQVFNLCNDYDAVEAFLKKTLVTFKERGLA